ncbi:MAG: hypothetical protein KDD58_11300 [Bdellovibrionales bacterium]|nr:hypothetical protein [Bdellovibrionales bacterium]
MKKAKDILKELGFNKEAPLSTQKAFLNNLTKQAAAQKFTRKKPKKELDKQLTLPGLEVQIKNNKQVS